MHGGLLNEVSYMMMLTEKPYTGKLCKFFSGGRRLKPQRGSLSRLAKIILPFGARFIPAGFVARRLRTTSTRPPRALPAVRLEPQLSKLILLSLLSADSMLKNLRA